ncbi:hypothetical protein [Streptomyces sp. NPDC093598]|uniref:hypothetical protein n=1 Tax=Streptomyces sp. NPDC093598 TaxID=3366046 RepID=UPI00380B8447
MTFPQSDPSPLRALQLSSGQVEMAADFHEAYARLVLAEAESESAGRPSRSALVEAASAYRLAGQWRLLVDPDGARLQTLPVAAQLFTRAGLAFGAFLQASLVPENVTPRDVTREDVEPSPLAQWTRRLLNGAGRREPDRLLDHPQQQVYLLLACASLAGRDSDARAALTRFATESPHRVGVVPVGSLAMPVRMFWGLALDLMEADDDRSARSYVATLAELSRAYAKSIDLAMANELTWFKAAAPVDVADLDVIGAMAMGARRFGVLRMRRLLTEFIGELPALARVPLSIGLRVAGPPGPDLGPPRDPSL